MDSLSISLSALRAYATQLKATANNVANFQTPGYKAQRVVLTSGPSGGVTAAVTRDLSPGMTVPREGQEAQEMSNVDLGREMVDLILIKTGYQANARVLQVTEETKGKVIDIIG
ncbi:MAG: hypothetical protein JRG97_09850 [Deltaproteobacteria bacterium]|nr:hypothetical protein [Deltaproteobacteria bacterium]MBW2052672.1 hypothetical protein [Deltaproteobacteria bacterium]MBW2141359.1 hypothetical protein [Deltaproteobacteria bacterium]MBW2322748.1 hypothetical protein [Deltaproteobacteria bacterium]